MDGSFRFHFHCILPFACDSAGEEKTKRQAVAPVRCRLSSGIAQKAAQNVSAARLEHLGLPPPPFREGSERDAFCAHCTRCAERRRQPIPVAFIVQVLSCVSFIGIIIPINHVLCHNSPANNANAMSTFMRQEMLRMNRKDAKKKWLHCANLVFLSPLGTFTPPTFRQN